MTIIDTIGSDPVRQRRASALTPDASRADPDRTDFLRLLTAQLAHQDPLAPNDATAFVEQLATFTSLEQLGNIKSSLDSLAAVQTSVISATAVSFAGRTATIEAEQFEHTRGEPVRLGAYLENGGRLRATIKDSAGNVVRQMELGTQDPGVVPFEWDGLTNDGKEASGGRYTLVVEVVDGDEAQEATPLIRAEVESVTFDKGYAELRILGRRYPLGSIFEIG